MITRVILFGIFLASTPILLHSQAQKDIPVYPGAKLDPESEPGEEAVCCSFSTADPLDKVIAFYEAALKSKAFDIPGLAKKYPVLKVQFQQMKQQFPPDVRYLAFVINEPAGENQGPVLFEIISVKGRVNFSLSEQDLGRSGARLAYEFRKATGTLDNIDQMYESWSAHHPAAKQEQFDFPVYPGSLIESINLGGSDDLENTRVTIKGEKCYYVTLCILDTLAFDKVTAFYQSKLKGKFTAVPLGDDAGKRFEMEERQFFWKEVGGGMEEFHGKKGDVNRVLIIELVQSVPQMPYFDREQMTRVAGDPLPCIMVTFTSSMLGKCTELPKETRRSMYQGGE